MFRKGLRCKLISLWEYQHLWCQVQTMETEYVNDANPNVLVSQIPTSIAWPYILDFLQEVISDSNFFHQ
jgi:hypothetical protein